MRTICGLAVLAAVSVAAAGESSLLQTIAEWQYPGSQLHGAQAADGATVDGRGNRTTPSVVSKVVMTTDAPVEKVLDYYRAKLSPKPNAGGGAPDGVGRSVDFSDDSDGRPFALHPIVVNQGDGSTTLVINRGKGEAKTHIGWKHYRRLSR